MEAKDELTFRRPNWFAPVGEEVRATHEGVGLFEVSAYAKYAVEGPGAEAWLGRILANRLPAKHGPDGLEPDVEPGRPNRRRFHGDPSSVLAPS